MIPIPPSIQAMGIAAIIAFLAGSASSWYITSSYKDAAWSSQVEATRAELAEVSQKATASALQQERAARLQLNTLEVKHESVQRSMDQLARENRRLVSELGGLRDPGRTRHDGAVQGAAAVSGQPESAADTGARLSVEASDFLLEFAEQADRAAAYAAACRDWAAVVTPEVATP